MIKNLLIFCFLACAGVLSAQTYTFECVVNGRLSGDSCDVCPNTIIESRSFNGLVIFRDSAFYKWIDQPYSVRVKPGGIVEYWEHAVNPFSERVTIPFSETGFFTVQGMADSTWCNSVAPHRYQELSLDSLSTTLAKAKLQAGNTGIGLRAGTSVTFDWQNDTLQINVDTTGLGGGGGGSGVANNGVSDNEDGGKFRLGNRYMGSPDAPFTMARKVNIDGRLLHIGDLSDSTLFVVDGATDRVGIRTDAPAKDFHVNGEVRISDLTNGTPDRVVGANSSGDISRLFLSGLSVSSGVLRASDSSATNEIQQIDTFAIVSNILRASLSQDGVPFKSVDLSPYVNVGTDLTFTGASSPYTLNSSTGTDVTFTQGTGITITRSANDLSIASTITQGYNKIRNNAGTLMTTREAMQFLNSTRITITLADDVGNAETDIAADLVANSVADAYLSKRAALSVMGRPANSTGNVADIVSASNGQVLRRSGTTLGFGTVATLGIADQAVSYVKIQNAAANNVLLGNNNGATSSYEEINAAAAQTMLGYIDGNLVAGGRVAYSSDANTITTEAAFLYSAVNDRMTIVSTTPALGAGAAILNLQNAGNDPSGEFLRMDGNITGNLLAGMSNSSTTAATDNTLFYISQAGNSAGDPILQLNITGANGTNSAIGLDNSDGNKLKLSPSVTTPGANADKSLVGTNDLIPLWGINKDAPERVLDVNGGARAINVINTSAPPTASNLGTGLGTGGSVDAITGGNNGFTVTFTVGTAPVADGPLFRLTFANPFTTTSHAVMNFNRDPDTIIDRDKILINGTSPGFIDLKANGTMTASRGHILVFNLFGQ